MSWAMGLIVVLVLAIGLPWLIAELVEVAAMRRRVREREAWKRYIELIERESWKGPK